MEISELKKQLEQVGLVFCLISRLLLLLLLLLSVSLFLLLTLCLWLKPVAHWLGWPAVFLSLEVTWLNCEYITFLNQWPIVVLKKLSHCSDLRACVYIYIRQLSSFRAPTMWFIDLTFATCHIEYTLLSLCLFFFPHEKTDKTREYSKSAIFVWYDNVRRRLLVAQSISSDKASLNVVSFCLFQSGKSSMTVSDVQELQIEKEKVK